MKLMCTLVAAAAVGLLAAGHVVLDGRTELIGTVGPGFTITLKQAGKAVKTLKAGTYTFVVADKASIHNFEIEARARPADKAITTVPFIGTKTVTIGLRAGNRFFCRPTRVHVRHLKGHLAFPAGAALPLPL